MILNFTRSTLLTLRLVKAESTEADKPVLSGRHHRRGEDVVRRESKNPEINDDRYDNRMPEFFVQVTDTDCTSTYIINTLNHCTNTSACGREITTVLTERSHGVTRKRESEVCHRNLVVI